MIYIYLIILCIIFKCTKKRNALNIGLYVIYIISALAAIILLFIGSEDSVIKYNTNYAYLIYLLIVLLICINGFSNFSLNYHVLDLNRSKILLYADKIGWLYIPVIFLLIYNDYNVLTNVDLSSYRIEADYYSTGLFKGGKLLSICVYLSELFFIPQFLFFYLLPCKDVSKSLKLRLLLASFAFVFMTLMFAGRDGIVFWIMNSVIFFLLFKKTYNKNMIKKIKVGGFFLCMLALIPFMAISIARFYVTGTGSFVESISPFISYIGQGPHIFCQSYIVDPMSIQGYEMSSLSTSDIQNLQLHLGWTFGTFVRTFVWTFGKVGGVLVALFFNFVSRIAVNMYNKKSDIWSFFIIWMLFQIPFWGVFYYRYSINSIDIVYSIFTVVCIVMYNKTRYHH